MVAMAQGDTAGAAERFRSVAESGAAIPDHQDEAVFHLAEIAYFAGDMEGALQLLRELSLTPTADIANDALSLSTLLEMNHEHSADVLAEVAHADFLVRQRKFGEALVVLGDAIQKATGQPLFDDVLLKRASSQEALGQYREALETYARMRNDSTETVALGDRALFRSAEVNEFGLRDTAAAIAAYEQLLEEYPGSIYNSLARRRIRRLRGEVL